MSPRKSVNPNERKRSEGKKIHIFFENIQARRLELGLKQSELAAQLGITREAVSRMESGVFPNDPSRLVELADALDIPLDCLFGRT